jgi:hypothetical protein
MSNTANKPNVAYKVISEKLVEGKIVDEIVVYIDPDTGKKRHVPNYGWSGSAESAISQMNFARDYFFAQGQLHALNYFKEWVGKIYADKYKKQICMDKIGARIEGLEELNQVAPVKQTHEDNTISDYAHQSFRNAYATQASEQEPRVVLCYNYSAIKNIVKQTFADNLDINSDAIRDDSVVSPKDVLKNVWSSLEEELNVARPEEPLDLRCETVSNISLKVADALKSQGRLL